MCHKLKPLFLAIFLSKIVLNSALFANSQVERSFKFLHQVQSFTADLHRLIEKVENSYRDGSYNAAEHGVEFVGFVDRHFQFIDTQSRLSEPRPFLSLGVEILPPGFLTALQGSIRGKNDDEVGFDPCELAKKFARMRLGKWSPIKQFADAFKYSASHDSALGSHPNFRLYLQLIENYYDQIHYLDQLRIIAKAVDQLYKKSHQLWVEVESGRLKLKPSELKEKFSEIHRAAILQASGPVFQKIFQKLGELDLKPSEFSRMISALQEDIEPEPDDWVKRKIISEFLKNIHLVPLFKKDLDRLTSASLDKIIRLKRGSIGAGTIGQTHLITVCPSGTRSKFSSPEVLSDECVVKVQRPNIAEIIEREIPRIEKIAAKANLVPVANSIISGVRDEAKYSLEKHNLSLADAIYSHQEKNIQVAGVPNDLHFGRSDEALLMERAGGKSYAKIYEQGATPKRIPEYYAMHLDTVALYQRHLESAFEKKGYFHADPHGGNLMYEYHTNQNHRVWVIDLGSFGQLDRKKSLADVTISLLHRDVSRFQNALIDLVQVPEDSSYSEMATKIIQVCMLENPTLQAKKKVLDWMDKTQKTSELSDKAKLILDTAPHGCLSKVYTPACRYLNPVKNVNNQNQYSLFVRLQRIFDELAASGIEVPSDVSRFNISRGLMASHVNQTRKLYLESGGDPTRTIFDEEEFYMKALRKVASSGFFKTKKKLRFVLK